MAQATPPPGKQLSVSEVTTLWQQAVIAAHRAKELIAGHVELLRQICEISGKPEGVEILTHLKSQHAELEQLRAEKKGPWPSNLPA